MYVNVSDNYLFVPKAVLKINVECYILGHLFAILIPSAIGV